MEENLKQFNKKIIKYIRIECDLTSRVIHVENKKFHKYTNNLQRYICIDQQEFNTKKVNIIQCSHEKFNPFTCFKPSTYLRIRQSSHSK